MRSTPPTSSAFPQWREILKNARFGSDVVDFQANLIGERRSTLTMLWGGAIFVLLIGCVNVANLVLVRSTSRIRELATRHAMGATFGRLARQALTESTCSRSPAVSAGLGLGWWALRAAPFFGFDRLPSGVGLALDARRGRLHAAADRVVGIGVGLIPVIAMRRANMAQVIREEGRSGTQGRGPRLMRRVLVTSQVAFALMLLIGAGVLLASFERVLTIDPGFRADNVLTGTISLPASRYQRRRGARAATDAHSRAAARGARRRSRRRDDDAAVQRLVQRQRDPRRGLSDAAGRVADLARPGGRVSDGYFEAMGAKLVAGRYFNADDVGGAPARADHRRAPGATLLAERRRARQADVFSGRHQQPDGEAARGSDDDHRRHHRADAVARAGRYRGRSKTGAYYSPMRQAPARTLGLAIRTGAGARDA